VVCIQGSESILANKNANVQIEMLSAKKKKEKKTKPAEMSVDAQPFEKVLEDLKLMAEAKDDPKEKSETDAMVEKELAKIE